MEFDTIHGVTVASFCVSGRILTYRYWKKNVDLQLKLPCYHCGEQRWIYQDNITRGHSLKLFDSKWHYCYLRNYSFSVKIVNICNSLPASVITANNINTLKNILDRFWANHESLCDCKSTLTGTGHRNFVDNVDDTIFWFLNFCIAHLMGIEALAFAFFQLCFAFCFVCIIIGYRRHVGSICCSSVTS